MDIRKLSSNHTKNGFLYKLVQRNDKAAIYEQFEKAEKKRADLLSTHHWEVFKIKIEPHREKMRRFCEQMKVPFVADNYSEYKEKFPADSEFGESAWSFEQLKHAINKFEELSKDVE